MLAENSVNPIWYQYSNFCLVFEENSLRNATYNPPNRINLFSVSELDTWSGDLNSDFTLKDWLFGELKLAKYDPNISILILYRNICSG